MPPQSARLRATLFVLAELVDQCAETDLSALGEALPELVARSHRVGYDDAAHVFGALLEIVRVEHRARLDHLEAVARDVCTDDQLVRAWMDHEVVAMMREL